MRLIDADALWDKIQNEPWYNNADRDMVEDWILNAPTVYDADEVEYALTMQKKYNAQYHDDIKNPLEPLKITSALNSEILKFEYRKEHAPKEISILDYTIISALMECLKRRTK